ncbi:meiosis-specific with OB domain-containing protein isoform X2 [Anoplopoma fimbria]|uniref:meiosis-specific with OB domain-containing protein isoform X2 n=1 Tax=Anoplopoma fimbria TaxID=229290 RepID=UPI0023EB3E4D|nr:meiosis-specific with OB domain-containing protein isoform X2 [Anoplopoma fimbria]
MAAQTYIAISELHPNFSHPRVLGIIIGKTDVKSFPDRKNIGVDRFTFSFTIKDSHDFFINGTAWGNDGYINGLSNSFNTGDCVIVENPLVTNKDPEKGDRFCPTTPSLYRLLVSEAHSQVSLCDDIGTIERLLPLLHLPVKDSRDFYSLADIVANGQKLDGTVINILAAVKSIGELKQFTTSDRRSGQRLEVKLFDDSVSSFPLVCWDREAIQLVQTLIPKETGRKQRLLILSHKTNLYLTFIPACHVPLTHCTEEKHGGVHLRRYCVFMFKIAYCCFNFYSSFKVLFIADAKISFDSFRSGMTASVNSKTIITVNPDTREASLLFSYAKEVSESGALDQDEKPEDMPVDSITDVYTVSQLKQKAQENPEPFFGITYSFISRLDLDSSVSKVIKARCSRCKFQVTEDAQSCTNLLCPGRDQALLATTGFDLLVDFTDHTGTLHACSLRSPVAEKTLGYPRVYQFD